MTTRNRRHHNGHNGKRGHHNEDGRNLSTDLDGNSVVKLIWLTHIAKNGKSFYQGYFPYSWSYVESGLQGKSDRDLHALAGYYHRDFTTAAWNMCCKNRKKHGIWGSDDDVERAHEAAILPGYTKGDVDNPKRKHNKKPEFDGNTLCALFK